VDASAFLALVFLENKAVPLAKVRGDLGFKGVVDRREMFISIRSEMSWKGFNPSWEASSLTVIGGLM